MNSRWVRRAFVVTLLYLCCIASPGNQLLARAASVNVSAPSEARAETAPGEGRESQGGDWERRVSTLEARSEAQANVTEWFSILIAVVGLGFGALVTGVVVFFALRTEKSAIAAAREELASSRQSIDEHVIAAQAAAASAQHAVQEIETHRQTAAETSVEIRADADELHAILEKVSAAADQTGERAQLTVEEEERLNEAALSLAKKPRRELTPREFDVLLTEANQKEDWYSIRDLARSLRMFYSSDQETIDSLFWEALAQYNLGNKQDSLLINDEIICRFERNKNDEVRSEFIVAMYNKATILRETGENTAASELYSSIIRRYRTDASLRVQAATAKSLCNRAHLFKIDGHEGKAMTDLNKALKIIGDSTDESFTDVFVYTALYKATLLKERGRRGQALRVLDTVLARRDEIKNPDLLRYIDTQRDYLRDAQAEQAE